MVEVSPKSFERRSGKDRRRVFTPGRLFFHGTNRRGLKKERRSREERRDGWVRVGKWSGVLLKDLKIAKFLKLF